MDKSKEKWNLEGEDKWKTKNETELEEKKDFKRQAFRVNKIQKPLKLQENSLFAPFYETQAQKHRGKKTKQKNRPK